MTGDERKKVRDQKVNAANEAKYGFLNNLCDANQRKPGNNLKSSFDLIDDPEYDPRTLHIPQSFWRDATPFEKQYWPIKAAHFDTIVFVKKGTPNDHL